MKIAFVCNQNLARSRVLAAYFSKILPQHSFSSFGIIAQEGRSNAEVINSILGKWELPNLDEGAKNINTHRKELMACDIVVSISEFISSYVTDLGFKGVIVDLELESVKLGLTLVDPQLISQSRCELELAKYLKVAYTGLVNLDLVTKFRFTALIPVDEKSVEIALSVAIKNGLPKVILYADLIAPVKIALEISDVEYSKYKFNAKLNLIEHDDWPSSDLATFIYPSHPTAMPHHLYLSNAWFQFLASLDSDELCVVTPPLTKSHGVVPESLLSALGAREIKFIGQMA
jgi:protein-tyrosine-phosphatase